MKTTGFNMNACKSDRGFTLLEILAALAILGTALFILLDAHFSALSLHVEMEEEVMTRQFLEQTVAKAEVGVMMGALEDADEFGDRYPDYTWSYQAARMGEEDDLAQLFSVTATVTGPIEERTLTFYVYDIGLAELESDGNRMFKK